MFTKNWKDALLLLIDEGVEVTLEKHHGVIGVNLNTRTKSDLIVVENDPSQYTCASATGYGRYDKEWGIDVTNSPDRIVKDLCIIVKECMCGRDYVDINWWSLLNKNDGI
ncbi:hypothetical protein S14_100 [Shewanella sp. phage 1/4]|uniref:hypothetical protein n=1 Tax=Shewanella phage 1/4 TaxID=1458859 RepID=UPI0004F79655|nr:hypothetical protein S14_100 [Shewanella sp. phage 1/4]AHK11209.1 hypothetical protein S14_100 [Shewanella sp. phage 1/4]